MRVSRRLKCFVVVLIGMLFASFGLSEGVWAANYTEKIVLQGVLDCYKQAAVRTTIDLEKLTKFDVTDVLNPPGSSFGTKKALTINNDDNIRGKVSCETVFESFAWKGSGTTAEDILVGMGYSIVSDEGECRSLSFGSKDPNIGGETNQVCKNKDGSLTVSQYKGGQYGVRLFVNNNGDICADFPTSFKNEYTPKISKTCVAPDFNNSDWLHEAIDEICQGKEGNYSAANCGGAELSFGTSSNLEERIAGNKAEILGAEGVNREIALDQAGVKAVGYLSGSTVNVGNLGLSSIEKRMLYQDYLENFYGATVTCDVQGSNSSWTWIEWGVVEGDTFKVKKCIYQKGGENSEKSVNGVNGAGFLEDGTIPNEATLVGLIGALGSDYSGEEIAEFIEQNGNRLLDPDGGGRSDRDACYKAGVEAQSWILCPAVNNMAKAVDGFDALFDGWLSVDDDWYSDTSKAYEVWVYFRDIANLAMGIFLLIIIFSQLTGVGIDNYGIKKMLPKLIMMAILINLSFLICQIAVDISNIFGVGLNDLLQSIGRTENEGVTLKQVAANVVAGLFGALAGVGAIAGTALTIATIAIGGGGAMIVISLVLVLLSAMVAVLLFFLTLGARYIIILVFMVLSPVAFACYILPNTQKYFKKWWDVFKAALVVYPICGLLYGMSFVIRSIIFGGSGDIPIWMALVGVLAPYFPFILLPGLLKSSLAGLGALGGVLAMIGGGVRKGIGKGNEALRGTSAYKSQQEGAMRRANAWRAGFEIDKKTGELKKDEKGEYIPRKMGKFGKFWRGGDIGMGAARRQLRKDAIEMNQEAGMATPEGFALYMAGAQAEIDEKRDKDAAAALSYGMAKYEHVNADGTREMRTVDSTKVEDLSAYHRNALLRHANAKDEEARRKAMSEVRAVEAAMSKTDDGRSAVFDDLHDMRSTMPSTANTIKSATQYIRQNFGDTYKQKDRGTHAFFDDVLGDRAIKTKQEYALEGVRSYDESTWAGADDRAHDGVLEVFQEAKGIIDGGGTINEDMRKKLRAIYDTNKRTLEMSRDRKISLKGKVLDKFEALDKIGGKLGL